MASWSVICFANEAPEHLKAFVAWHLGMGAERIHLMLDDPADGIAEMFDHLPQVDARVFRPNDWPKPADREKVGRHDRHNTLSTMAYHAVTSDWALHIDVDEFIFPTEDVADLLARIPDDIPAIRIYAADRLLPEGYTHWASDTYRLHTETRYPEWLDKIYDHPDQFMFGLRGHSNGKLFIRSGMDGVKVMSHRISREKPISIKHSKWSDDFTLLHMFVFDYDHYQRKADWKFMRGPGNQRRDAAIENPTRRDQRRIELSEAFEQGNTDAQRRIFDDLFVFSDERVAQLAKYQRVEMFDFTGPLARYMQQYFP